MLCIMATALAFAQKDGEGDALKIAAGGTFGKPKIFKDMKALAIPQATVYYKTATTEEIVESERGAFGRRKTDGGSVAGRVTAYLAFSDAEPTAADFQKLTDDFYGYLLKQLSAAGVQTVAWDKVTGGEFYKNESLPIEEVQKDLDQMKKRGQIYVMNNANSGNILLKQNIINPMAINTGFAFMKAKRAASYFDDMNASGAFLHVIVDFADIALDGDVHTSKSRDVNYVMGTVTTKVTKNYSMKHNVEANMHIPANSAYSTLYNNKMVAENVQVAMPIEGGVNFASKVESDPNMEKLRNKDNLFAKDFNMTPVVVTTTKEAYMTAAAKTLQAYADNMINLIKKS